MLDGQGVQARFSAPTGIAVDGAGNIYVAEFVNDTVRKITPDGAVTLLAGSPGNPGWKDEKGDNAHFRNPWSIAVDSRGNVFVADKDNFVIRQIAPDGRVTTLAGQPGVPGFSDGAGSIARFRDPHGIAVDGSGNIYVADTANQAIRKITSLGVVTTIAQGLSNPESVAVDSAGAVYVADAQGIHKISGSRSDLVPEVSLGADSSGPLAHADAIAVSPTGTLYLADTLHNVICSPSVR
jgi:sugar lactone lactonase YvrE